MANRFLDRTNKSGDFSGTWTFTNGSASVTGVGGNAQTLGLTGGDYVKPATTNEWYKIASVGGENSITLAYNFAQATQADVVAEYADVSVKNGTTTALAFVHINQYTTDEVRVAGDVLYVRRGQTNLHQGVNISLDESSSEVGSYITIIADDGTNWPGEGGFADPIFYFSGSAMQLVLNRQIWKLEELHFKDSHHGYGNINAYGGLWGYIKNCKFEEATSGYGSLFIYNTVEIFVDGCSFDNNVVGFAIYGPACGRIINSTVDNNSTAGFIINSSTGKALLILENVGFGETIQNAVDINISGQHQSLIYCINVRLASPTEISGTNLINWGSLLAFMDKEGKNVNIAYYGEGTIERVTSPLRTGGATTTIKAIPTARCDDDSRFPFQMYETWIYSDGTQKTYTIYMQASGGWAALPTNAQLYIEVQYFNDANAGRGTVTSTEVISAEDTWTALTVTCDPSGAGPVRIRAYLKKYEASKKIYVDPKVVIS